ncbi:DNA methyltransferase [Streptomyces sp. NBC_01221]|uniref:type ISP restriction/modification enzyme n=1 Tax=unclassified Streptomyces TaxID=2593676 RepID=UPI00224ED1E8|nr:MULTISPECIES: type ISP restriction/modification enzyme [unclassified Streptomyces]MCX4785738.1 DNA methyltransferase [Streptomyces sp. NBC_01221]WSJ39633.1 DNA methyltransferase [Streptomyces sp. NBC_01321]
MAARAGAGAGGGDDSPLLDDLMPWSVRPLRTGRPWVRAPDAGSLRARWERLVRTEAAERERLFGPTRLRTPRTPVAALPGQATGTGRFARESGPCPEPVRILHGPFDEQWLLPDHRLIDAARPELWRVADGHQLFAVEHGYVPQDTGPALSVTALLPDGHSPAGRPGRIRPLYRRPGGLEPNLVPGLLALLRDRHGDAVTDRSVLAWTLAAARHSPAGCVVPLPADTAHWSAGVELGQELLRLQLRGARGGERPRLPGGRRPYVRASVPPVPATLEYDPADEALLLGTGRISPVPAGAWEFRVGGVRMLELWFERRTTVAGAGAEDMDGLEAVRPRTWLQEWTSELLELITLLALLAELRPRREGLTDGPRIAADDLRAAGVLPVPVAARRPASVLDHQEEGPDGQFALL